MFAGSVQCQLVQSPQLCTHIPKYRAPPSPRFIKYHCFSVSTQSGTPHVLADLNPSPQVETDGRLVLISGSASAAVYAFSADADTTGIGHVFYRESSEPNVLSRVRELSDTGFSGSVNLTHAFIATWFYVGYDDNHDDLVSSSKATQVHHSLSLSPPSDQHLPECAGHRRPEDLRSLALR